MVKAIFIDLDGTLLRTWNINSYSKKDFEFLKTTQKRGIYTVLCTGRSQNEATMLQKKLRVNKFGNYVIHSSGGTCENIETGEVLFDHKFSTKITKPIIDFAKKYNFAVKLDNEDVLYTDQKNKYKKPGKILGYTRKKLSKDLKMSEHDVRKIGMIGFYSRRKNQKIWKIEKPNFKNIVMTLTGKDFYFEFTPKKSNKGEGIKALMERLKINCKATVGIGDSMNDYPMFKVVGISVAMKNAKAELKEIATYVTKSCRKNGVAHVGKILKFTKNGKN